MKYVLHTYCLKIPIIFAIQSIFYYHFSVLALWLLPGLISSVAESDIEESFAEELYLKPLTDGKVLAYAQFTTLSGRYMLTLISDHLC